MKKIWSLLLIFILTGCDADTPSIYREVGDGIEYVYGVDKYDSEEAHIGKINVSSWEKFNEKYNLVIDIPNEIKKDIPITRLGGTFDNGNENPFMLDVKANYDSDKSIYSTIDLDMLEGYVQSAEVIITIFLNENIKEIYKNFNISYELAIVFEETKEFKLVNFYYYCNEENNNYYAIDGSLYNKETNELISEYKQKKAEVNDKKILDYVEINDVVIPVDYFNGQMFETDDISEINLRGLKMIGESQHSNFEYGNLITADLPEDNSIISSNYELNTYENNEHIKVNYYHRLETNSALFPSSDDKKDETYQYEQTVNGKQYCLNETNSIFSASDLTVEYSGNANVWHYTPRKILDREVDTINYKIGIIGGITYLSIKQTYVDENITEYDQVSSEIIYLIKDSEIIAWYYCEIDTSLNLKGYWKREVFCKPLESSIALIPESTLKQLM